MQSVPCPMVGLLGLNASQLGLLEHTDISHWSQSPMDTNIRKKCWQSLHLGIAHLLLVAGQSSLQIVDGVVYIH